MIDSPVLVLNQSYEPLNLCRTRRAIVLLFRGKAKVISTDLLNETVTVQLLDGDVTKEIALDELVRPEEKSYKEADETQR